MPASAQDIIRPCSTRRAPISRPARSQPYPTPTGVNPLCLPQRARALISNSLAPLREQAFAAWINRLRQPMATLITLAVDEGWLSETELEHALDSPQRHEHLYQCFMTALQGLPGWLRETAQHQSLDPLDTPDWRPFVQIGLHEDGGHTHLVLTASCYWHHAFILNALPPALAVAIAHTLQLIGLQLTETCLLRDIGDLWMEESAQAYHDLCATGLREPADLWASVQEETALLDGYGWLSQEDFEAWWVDTASYCDPPISWLKRWQPQRWRDPNVLRAGLVRRLWRWRRRPEIARLPWFRWLRCAVLTLCRCARHWPEPPARALTVDEYGDNEPLGYAQPIGFGEGWEEDFLEDFYEHMANAGMEYEWVLRCHVLAYRQLRDTLEAFAIGQGLLIGATQAHAASMSTCSNTGYRGSLGAVL